VVGAAAREGGPQGLLSLPAYRHGRSGSPGDGRAGPVDPARAAKNGVRQLAPDCQMTAIAMLATVSSPIVAHTHVATASDLR